MRAISVYVEEEEYQRFKSLAGLEGRPVAALIREAMSDYLDREVRPGRSILDIPAHDSGRLLHDWTRSELYDEMLDGCE
jgi:Ribbon-helix-helix protein, copG family